MLPSHGPSCAKAKSSRSRKSVACITATNDRLRDSLIPGMGYERGRGTARMVGRDLRRTTGGLVFRYVDLATRVEFRRSSPRSLFPAPFPLWLIFAVNS